MKPDKLMSYIGFAVRAKKAALGSFATEKSVKSGKAKLVVIATDASDNTKKKFEDMCSYYATPLIFTKSRAELGRLTGCDERVALAINDEALASAAIKAYPGQ